MKNPVPFLIVSSSSADFREDPETTSYPSIKEAVDEARRQLSANEALGIMIIDVNTPVGVVAYTVTRGDLLTLEWVSDESVPRTLTHFIDPSASDDVPILWREGAP